MFNQLQITTGNQIFQIIVNVSPGNDNFFSIGNIYLSRYFTKQTKKGVIFFSLSKQKITLIKEFDLNQLG